MYNIKELHKISKNAWNEDGSLMSFGEQLYLREKGELAATDFLIISAKSETGLDAINNNLPLVIRQSIIKKIENKHEINAKSLTNLEKLIKNSPLAMDSSKKEDSYFIVLDKKDSKGNELVTVVQIDSERNSLALNEINTVHPRDIQDLINKTVENGRNIYTNKATKKWLLQKSLEITRRSSHDNNSLSETKEFSKQNNIQNEKANESEFGTFTSQVCGEFTPGQTPVAQNTSQVKTNQSRGIGK